MISQKQHRQIVDLLEEWRILCGLYSRVQEPGMLSVQVMGRAHEEFYQPAVEITKVALRHRAARIKGDLQQLDYDISELPALRERLLAQVNN